MLHRKPRRITAVAPCRGSSSRIPTASPAPHSQPPSPRPARPQPHGEPDTPAAGPHPWRPAPCRWCRPCWWPAPAPRPWRRGPGGSRGAPGATARQGLCAGSAAVPPPPPSRVAGSATSPPPGQRGVLKGGRAGAGPPLPAAPGAGRAAAPARPSAGSAREGQRPWGAAPAPPPALCAAGSAGPGGWQSPSRLKEKPRAAARYWAREERGDTGLRVSPARAPASSSFSSFPLFPSSGRRWELLLLTGPQRRLLPTQRLPQQAERYGQHPCPSIPAF